MTPDAPDPAAQPPAAVPADPQARGPRLIPALGYVGMLLVVVVGVLLLAMVLGERAGLGRVVWLAVGVVLGGLWAGRSRLPLLQSTSGSVAGGAWLGLIAAGLVTLAAAPTSMPNGLLGVPAVAASRERLPNGLRAAPPTAVRRTGTLGPSPQPKPAGTAVPASAAASPSTRPAARVAASPSPRPAARGVPTATAALPDGFDPGRYIGQGDAYSCRHFTSQAEAQAVLRADPSDPNVIDNDRDGIACEDNPDPRDTTRVPR
jgi:hypothetical protein